MTPGLAYSFSWFLNDADIAQVRDIIESLRQHAIDLGSKSVSEMEVQSDAHQVYFIATIPGSTEGKFCSSAPCSCSRPPYACCPCSPVSPSKEVLP